nr:hypothetical protein [Solirubrobacterales bacterium]
ADGRALRALADELGGPPTTTLQQAGQAVLVARQPQIAAIEARAAGRRQAVTTPGDPRLRAFVEFWLGRRAS